LAEIFIGWSYTRFVFLALIGNPTWLPGPIMCSDWSKFQWTFLPSLIQICFVVSEKKMKMWNSHRVLCQTKSSHGGHLEFPIGKRFTSTKLVNRLPIGNSRWPPWLDLV
jgi:hypothetical protein